MSKSVQALLAAIAFAAPLHAENAPAPAWTLSAGGGVTSIGGQGDQPFAQIGLKHSFGDAYVRGGVTYIDGGSGDLRRGIVPADTWQATLGGGASFDAVSLDFYVLAGSRSYSRTVATPLGTRRIAVSDKGSNFGAGASLTLDLPLGGNWFVSPSLAADYARVDVAVTATAANGIDLISQKNDRDGITGTGGATLQYLADSGASIGAYGAFVATSDAASVNRAGANGTPNAALRFVGDIGGSDSWAEYGVLGGVPLTPRLRLDVSVVRTQGLAGGETTSGAATLSYGF